VNERLAYTDVGEASIGLVQRQPVVLDERPGDHGEPVRGLNAVNGGLVVEIMMVTSPARA